MMKRNLGLLAAVGGILLLGACAQQAEERNRSDGAGTPAYQYQAPTQETSPLIHEQGDLGNPPAGMDEEAYNAAAEQCHNYARGVVLRDRRISHDRDAGRVGQVGASKTLSLQRSMQDFGEQGSYERHFTSCMASRGATSGQ